MRTLGPVNSVLYDCCCPHFLVWPPWQGRVWPLTLLSSCGYWNRFPHHMVRKATLTSLLQVKGQRASLQRCCLKSFAFSATFQLSSPMSDVEKKSVLTQNYFRLPQFPAASPPEAALVNLVSTSGLLWVAEAPLSDVLTMDNRTSSRRT